MPTIFRAAGWFVLALLVTVAVVNSQPTNDVELVGLVVRPVASVSRPSAQETPAAATAAPTPSPPENLAADESVIWAPLPLRTVEVESQVIDFCGEVNLTQTYINHTPFMLEAEYIFPLDENSAVTGFTAEINDRILVGVVKEKEVARHEFEVAKSRGQSTMLFEQQKENIFKIQIGNLPPNTTCKIKLSYITTLDLEGKTNRFVLPAIVAPKYDPSRYFGAGAEFNGEPAVQLQPCHDLQFFQEINQELFDAPISGDGNCAQTTIQFKQQHAGPQEFRMKLDVQMPSQITQIQSLSHPDQTKISIDDTNSTPTGPHHATITFGLPIATESGFPPSPSSSLDGRDFVLTIGQKDYLRTRAVLEIDPLTGSQAVQLAFAPQSLDLMDAAALQTEIIFVIDQSGSMQGSSIEGVRQALEVFMKSIPNACKFNLISFGSTYRKLFPDGSKYYSAETVQKALDYVRAIQANMGGTQIYYPLRYALESEISHYYPRHIFLLTDGQVTNTQQLVDLVRQYSRTSRLFTFGLGPSVDRHLVKELAKAGRGECEFIGGGSSAMEKQDVTSKVMRNLIRSFQTTFTQVHIDWSTTLLGGKTIQQSDDSQDSTYDALQSPVVIPPISPPNRSLIYGIGLNAPDNGTEIVNLIVKAESNRPIAELVQDSSHPNRLTWTVPLNLTQATFSRFIHKLGARARISEIQNWSSNHPNFANQKNEILKLSLKYQLLSSFSSFIIVDESDESMKASAGADPSPATFESQVVPVAAGGALPARFPDGRMYDSLRPPILKPDYRRKSSHVILPQRDPTKIQALDVTLQAIVNGLSTPQQQALHHVKSKSAEFEKTKNEIKQTVYGIHSQLARLKAEKPIVPAPNFDDDTPSRTPPLTRPLIDGVLSSPEKRQQLSSYADIVMAESGLTILDNPAPTKLDIALGAVKEEIMGRAKQWPSTEEQEKILAQIRSRESLSTRSPAKALGENGPIKPVVASDEEGPVPEGFSLPNIFNPVLGRADGRDQAKTLVQVVAMTSVYSSCGGHMMNVPPRGDSLVTLISLVSIDGLWSLTEPWLNIIQGCLRQSRPPVCTEFDITNLEQLSTAISQPPTVVATSLSLWCLETLFPDRSMEFAVLVGKSKGELRRAYGIETDKLAQVTQEIISRL